MVSEALLKHFRQSGTLGFDVLQQLLFLNDLLNLEAGRASKWIVLESVAVTESARPWTMLEGVVDLWADEHSGKLLETTGKTFADSLDVWCNIVLLPCVEVSGTAHTTHDFVEDE